MEDLDAVLPLLQGAWDVVASEFSERRAADVLCSTPWTLVWHGPADFQQMVGTMRVNTSFNSTELHLLAPTAYPRVGVDGFPHDYDRDWHFKNLIHECTAAFMFQYRAPHPRWPLAEGAPGWFREGLQEAVAIERAPVPIRNRYRAMYSKRDASRTIRPMFSSVDHDYSDGYLIVRCFYELFGRLPVHQILDREYADFWTTVEAAFGSDLRTVHARWLHWRDHNATQTPGGTGNWDVR